MGTSLNSDLNRSTAPGTRPMALQPVRTVGMAPIVLSRGRLTIGRAETCHVRLDVEGVSSQHAVIVVGAERVVIRAWDPRTWIDEGPIREATLRPGHRLTIGPITFQVRPASDDEVLAAVAPSETEEQGQQVASESVAGVNTTTGAESVAFMDVAELARTPLPQLENDDWDASAGVEQNLPTDAATGGWASIEVEPAGIASADDPQPAPEELLAAWDELRMAQETFARESADRRIAMSLDARSLHALRTRLTSSLQNVEHRNTALERAAKLLEQRTTELDRRALDLIERERQLSEERDRLEAAAADARREVTAQLEQHQAAWREWNETHGRMSEQLEQQLLQLDQRRHEFAQEAADWQAAQHSVLQQRAAAEAAQAEVDMLRETLRGERAAWELESKQLTNELTCYRRQIELQESTHDSEINTWTRQQEELTQQQRQLLRDRAELDAARAALTLQQQQTAEHAAHQQSEWDLQWANLRAAQELLIAERAAFATEQTVWEEARRAQATAGLVPSYLAQLELAEESAAAVEAPVEEFDEPEQFVFEDEHRASEDIAAVDSLNDVVAPAIDDTVAEHTADENVIFEEQSPIEDEPAYDSGTVNESEGLESFTPPPLPAWYAEESAPPTDESPAIDIAARVRDLTEEFAADDVQPLDHSVGLTPWELDAYARRDADEVPTHTPYEPPAWEAQAHLTDAYRETALDSVGDRFAALQQSISNVSAEETEAESANPVQDLRSELARMFDLPAVLGSEPEQPNDDPVAESTLDDEIEPEAPPAPQDDWRARLSSLMSTETDVPPAIAVESPKPESKVVAPVATAPADTAEDEDDSIATYMERLLARTRGDSLLTISSPKSQPAETSTTVEPVSTAVYESTAAGSTESTSTASTLHDHSHLQAEPKHRVNRDEARANLESFREVANMSARKAVATHSWQSTRSELTFKLGIAALCGVGTIVFLTGAAWQGVNQSLQGLVCLIGAGWMLWDIQRSAVKLRRLQRFVGPQDATHDHSIGEGMSSPSAHAAHNTEHHFEASLTAINESDALETDGPEAPDARSTGKTEHHGTHLLSHTDYAEHNRGHSPRHSSDDETTTRHE